MHKTWNQETMPTIKVRMSLFINQFKFVAAIISTIKDLDLGWMTKKFVKSTKLELPKNFYTHLDEVVEEFNNL